MKKRFGRVKIFLATLVAVATIISPLQVPTVFAAETIFSDGFEQYGTSLTNGWDSFIGADTPTRTTSGANSWAVNTGSKALLLQGVDGGGHGNDPDDGAERQIATLGHAELSVSYFRAFENNLTTEDDEFVAEYSLDDGASWTVLESVTPVNPATPSAALFDIANPTREAKLTLRFFMNGTAADDEAAIDDLEVTGENPPLFHDGFESDGKFTGWTATGRWDEEAGDVYTDSRKGEVDGDTGGFDDTLSRGISTEGYEALKVAYNYRISESLNTGDHVYSEWSLDGTNWTEIADHTDLGDGDWTRGVFSLPSSASNQTDFQFRFRADLGDGSDEIRIDDVMVWGEKIAKSGGGSSVPPGKLIVKKVVQGTSTDSIDFEDFLLDIEGAGFSTYTVIEDGGMHEYDVPPGPYLVTETADVVWNTTYGGDCEKNGEFGKVTVVSNETVTCTITNTWDIGVGGSPPDTGTLIVTKTIVGGPASFGDLSFTVDGVSYDFWEAGMNVVEVAPGDHVVREVPPEGYVPTYGGDCDEEGNVLFGSGETKTCTITNTYAVGGDLPTDEPTFTPTPTATPSPSPETSSTTGGTGSSDVSDAMKDETESDMMLDEQTAAISGTLSGFVPCELGGFGWLILDVLIAGLIAYLWRGRRDSRWIANILLIVLVAAMYAWADTCGYGVPWFPIIPSLLAWLWLKLQSLGQ